jgi:hypothetical protein
LRVITVEAERPWKNSPEQLKLVRKLGESTGTVALAVPLVYVERKVCGPKNVASAGLLR